MALTIIVTKNSSITQGAIQSSYFISCQNLEDQNRLDGLLLRVRVLQIEPHTTQGQSSNTCEGKPAESTLAV